MRKKVISLMMCLAFIICLVGCGEKPTETNNSSVEEVSSVEAQGGFDMDDDGATASGGIYKNIVTDKGADLKQYNDNKVYKGRATDLKGKTILVQSWGTGSTALNGTGLLPKRANALISSIEKTLNCQIKVLTGFSGYDTESTSGLAAGKPTADIIYLSKKDLISNYSYNRLVDLSSLNVMDFKDRSCFSEATELAKFNGKYYAVAPRCYGSIAFSVASCIYANVDVLTKCGVTVNDLTKWVDSKAWTWDKMKEVAAKVKSQGYTFMYDGTTAKDNEREHSLYSSLLASVGIDWVAQNSKGKFSFAGDSQKAKTVLDFYKSMYDKGYVVQTESAIEKFSSSDSAMLSAAMYTAKFNDRSSSYGNYVLLPLPLEKKNSNYTYATGDYSFAAIARGTKPSGLSDAEIATVLNLINSCLVSEKENESLVVQESIGWAKNALSQKTVKIYNDITAKNKFAVAWSGMILTNENMWIPDVFKFANGDLSKQQILAQSKSLNTKLEKFLDR